MGMRGALIIPVGVIVLFATSETPLADLGNFAIVVAFAVVGGALSGLAYSVLGRQVLKLKGIGRHLAGIITLAPYMFVMVHVIGFTYGERFLRRPSITDLVTGSIMAIVFGIALGFSWFRTQNVQDGPSRPAT
jgi:hypothetical protein